MAEEGTKAEEFNFGKFEIGEQFIIGEINEGADIQLRDAVRIFDIAKVHFEGAKWGYISRRKNEYSLQPTIHHVTPSLQKNMVAYALVTEMDSHLRSAHLEKRIVAGSYKFECFSDMKTAEAWIREEVRNAESY